MSMEIKQIENNNLLVSHTEVPVYDNNVPLPFRFFELIEQHMLCYFDEDSETSNARVAEIKRQKEVLTTILNDSVLTTMYLYDKVCVYVHKKFQHRGNILCRHR